MSASVPFSPAKARAAHRDGMKALLPLALLLAPALAAAPATAADRKPIDASPPPRVATLVVYGDDPCPRSSDEEIVVCARQPESERYRIPKELRNKRKTDIPSQSWASRVRTLDMVSKRGLPNSCSPEGSGGQTGCMRQFLEAARAEREAAKAEAEQ